MIYTQRFAKVYRLTDGLGLRIPNEVCNDMVIHRGEFFRIEVINKDTLILTRVIFVPAATIGETRDNNLPVIQNAQ
jgi:antitoxin component of MazEF toxin-antitoxin module